MHEMQVHLKEVPARQQSLHGKNHKQLAVLENNSLYCCINGS